MAEEDLWIFFNYRTGICVDYWILSQGSAPMVLAWSSAASWGDKEMGTITISCTDSWARGDTYIHTYIHNYIHVHTYIHTYIHVHTYIHTYILTYIHTDIHTYMYIHTY